MKRLIVILALAVSAAASAAPDGAPDLFKQGTALFGEERYPEAAEVLAKEVVAHPTHTQAYMYLASALEKIEQWAEAAAAWEKFAKLTPRADEKSFGEKRAKDCRGRAAGKGPEETPKPSAAGDPADAADPADPTAVFTAQQPVFFVPLKTPHFIVMAKNRALLEKAAAEAERHLNRIRNVFLFGREWSHTITLRIYKDHADYLAESGMPAWSGGGYSMRSDGAGGLLLGIDLFALDDKGRFIPDLLSKILPHELTHAVLHEYFGERTFSTLPRALNEGLAMYCEEGTQVLYERQLADAVKRNVYFKLVELFKMTEYPKNVGLFYAEAASVTRYLIEHLKGPQFETFLAEIKRGQDVNGALDTALARAGDLLTPMEANWLAMMKERADYYAKNPPPKTAVTSSGK